MLKTLDILLGATMVVLIFSLAVTVITQTLTNLLQRRGRHLRAGLTVLLQQLDLPLSSAGDIADRILRHPMIADGTGRLCTVVQRQELITLLLGLAAGDGPSPLEGASKTDLQKAIRDNGITDPAATLRNIRALALQLEISDPHLPDNVRQTLAIVHEASSDLVAKIHAWFDPTIARVSTHFTTYTHAVTLGVAVLVVFAMQLDIVAVVNRLSPTLPIPSSAGRPGQSATSGRPCVRSVRELLLDS